MSFVYKHMYGSWYERQVMWPIVVPISSVNCSTPQYMIVGYCVTTEEQAKRLMEVKND